MALVRIQTEEFDTGLVVNTMAQAHAQAGAVVSFTGYVRDFSDGRDVQALELEHYPGMTEKSLRAIAGEAAIRWPLLDVAIIHRVGRLAVQAPIVLVAVASAHRHAAFDACAYIMDYLKSQAPFWKKEYSEQGAAWVDARESDEEAMKRWQLAGNSKCGGLS